MTCSFAASSCLSCRILLTGRDNSGNYGFRCVICYDFAVLSRGELSSLICLLLEIDGWIYSVLGHSRRMGTKLSMIRASNFGSQVFTLV